MANHFFVREHRRTGFQVVRYLIAPYSRWCDHLALVPPVAFGVEVGGTWLGLGIIYMLFKTNFFRKPLPEFTGQV